MQMQVALEDTCIISCDKTNLNVDVDFDNDPNFVEREDTDLGDHDQDYVDVDFHGQDVLYDSDQDDDIFTHQGGGDFG